MSQVVNPIRKFNLDFCRRFTPEKLRLIYKSENPETVELLIKEIYPDKEVEVEQIAEVKPKKKTKK